jgi:hypothetical protein
MLADAHFGRAASIIKQREKIKRQTIEHRRLQHRKHADWLHGDPQGN